MDWIEFGSKAVEHLAWPGVAMYVLIKQKSAVAGLFGRITELEWGKAKAKFGREAADLAAEAKVLEAKPVEPPKLDAITGSGAAVQEPNVMAAQGTVEPIVLKPRLGTGQEVDPTVRTSSIIAGNWARFEDSIRMLAMTHKIDDAYEVPFNEVVLQLFNLKVLKWETVTLAQNLFQLRSAVVHSSLEPTREAATDFVDSCRKLEQRILSEEAAWQEVMKELIGAWKLATKTPK